MSIILFRTNINNKNKLLKTNQLQIIMKKNLVELKIGCSLAPDFKVSEIPL